MVRRITLIALVIVLLVAGCSSADDAPSDAQGVDLGDVTLAAALTPFDSCDALLDHLRTEGLERVGPYGLDGEIYYGFADMGFAEGDVDRATAGDAATSGRFNQGLPAPVTTVPTSVTKSPGA
jgi:hypothetical protein